MKVSKQLEKMFNMLDISEEHEFTDFVLGNLNHLSWRPKVPVEKLYARRGDKMVRTRKRPRATYKGRRDYLHRQLYRHFISDEIEGITLIPKQGREDYNPFHWKLGNDPTPAMPLTVNTAPKAIDQELQDLLDELRRRTLRGDPDIWEGVDEIFTSLEIAQAREILDDES